MNHNGWVGWVVRPVVSGGVGSILWLVVERERRVLPVNNCCGFPTEDELKGPRAPPGVSPSKDPPNYASPSTKRPAWPDDVTHSSPSTTGDS